MRGIRASASVRKKSKSYGIVTEYSLRGGSRSLNPTLVGLHRLQRISPNARKSALSESTDEKICISVMHHVHLSQDVKQKQNNSRNSLQSAPWPSLSLLSL